MPIKTEDFSKVEVASVTALWGWLEAYHSQSESVWLVTYLKTVPDKYISRDDVLDALVAYGWIDGIRRKLDDMRTMQLIAPRQQQAWAQSYKTRAARLIEAGQMQAPGLASIDAGKASGLWDFFADVDRLEVPADLAERLGPARADWDALPPSYRRNVLRWIKLAKTDKTRAGRMDAAAQATAQGQRLPQM